MLAAQIRHIPIIELLIKQGADIQAGGPFDEYPLLVAAKQGDIAMAWLLIE